MTELERGERQEGRKTRVWGFCGSLRKFRLVGPEHE